jgi:hypothetical protein
VADNYASINNVLIDYFGDTVYIRESEPYRYQDYIIEIEYDISNDIRDIQTIKAILTNIL